MEGIKVGEYVRNNKGNIGKVIGIFGGHCTAKYHIEFKGIVKVKRQYLSTNTIVKHSKNIIDLIEAGDYVNGYKVSDKESTLLITNVKGIDRSSYHIPISQYGDGIKSIVTKEQFARMEYRLED